MGKYPPNRPPRPQAWKNPVQRAVENIDVPIEDLVAIAEDSVVHPERHSHPLPPPHSRSGS